MPVLPIEERPVPGGGVPGELLSPTQPFPATIPPLVPGGLRPEDAWGYTFLDRAVCRRMIESARHGEYYLPPSREGTVNFPGMAVTNWGGGSFDPQRQLLIVPVNRAPTFTQLIPLDEVDPAALDNPMAGLMGNPGRLDGTPYAQVFKPLLSPLFSPCNPPPWGELVALDLATGKTRWRVPLGVLDKLVRLPLPLRWGTPTSGGPIITAGGLVFIGATMDERFRAFDVETGEQLWETADADRRHGHAHDLRSEWQSVRCRGRRRPHVAVLLQDRRLADRLAASEERLQAETRVAHAMRRLSNPALLQDAGLRIEACPQTVISRTSHRT